MGCPRSAERLRMRRMVAGPVHEDAQQREKSFAVPHLVDDHQAGEGLEREPGIGETRDVGRILQIEERHRSAHAFGQAPGQRRLADLPGADQSHDGELVQETPETRFVADAWNHGK